MTAFKSAICLLSSDWLLTVWSRHACIRTRVTSGATRSTLEFQTNFGKDWSFCPSALTNLPITYDLCAVVPISCLLTMGLHSVPNMKALKGHRDTRCHCKFESHSKIWIKWDKNVEVDSWHWSVWLCSKFCIYNIVQILHILYVLFKTKSLMSIFSFVSATTNLDNVLISNFRGQCMALSNWRTP